MFSSLVLYLLFIPAWLLSIAPPWLRNLIPHVTIEREKGVPYLTRYYLLGGPRYGVRKWFKWNLYLHCFHSSDEPIPHNHPWAWAKSRILRGCYAEYRRMAKGWELVRCFLSGDTNLIKRDDFHYVRLITDEVWTLFLSGPRVQEDHEDAWGFQTNEGFIPWGQYKEHRQGATFTGDQKKPEVMI